MCMHEQIKLHLGGACGWCLCYSAHLSSFDTITAHTLYMHWVMYCTGVLYFLTNIDLFLSQIVHLEVKHINSM